MPTFSRLKIKPSAELIYKFAVRTFVSWIPTGYRWFERDKLNGDAELGKEIRVWAKVGADLRTAIETERWEVFLATADHDQLTAFGTMLSMTQRAGETDDQFATRIAAELVAKRVTRSALEALIPNLTNNQVASELFLPWKHVIIWGQTWWDQYLASPRFWRGATFELQANDTLPDGIEEAVDRTMGGGVLDWYARIISTNLDQNDDPDGAIVDGIRQSFVTSSVDTTIESFGCGTDFTVVSNTLTNTLDLVGPDMGNLLTWGMGLTFENILTNYALATDMLLSAQTGIAHHYVKVTTPFDVYAVTDIQAGAISWADTYLDDGSLLDDPGDMLGP